MTEQEAMRKYTTLKDGTKTRVLGEWKIVEQPFFPRLTYYRRHVMPYGMADICSWKVCDNDGTPTGENVYVANFKGYSTKVHVIAEEAMFDNLEEAKSYCDKYVLRYIEQYETVYGAYK